VRRISGGGKKGSFMRNDFANEVIENREVDDEHRLLRPEGFSGVNCDIGLSDSLFEQSNLKR
jgi:hypothetical protein